MVLLRNLNTDQYVFFRVRAVSANVVQSTTVDSLASGTFTIGIYKDNNAVAALSKTVTFLANGLYKFALSSADIGTSTYTGVISITNSGGHFIEPIYFETADTNPTVGGVVGNIGTTSSPVTMYVSALKQNDANTATTVYANTTGNITGNLSGSVGSVTGAVGSVTGAVGSVTGAVGSVTGSVGGPILGNIGTVGSPVQIYATHTGSTVGSITGNITGNLSGSVGSVTGAVGSVTGAVGSVTGNVGGNVNGNVVGSVGSVVAGVSDASTIVNAIKAATYDSISQDNLFKLLAAFIAGKVDVTETVGDPTSLTIKYWLPNAGTQILQINASKASGARGTAGTIGPGA